MKKSEIKGLINYYLKEDSDFSNDCYTEWEYNCNCYEEVKTKKNSNSLKYKKVAYKDICKNVVDNILNIIPENIKNGDEQTVTEYLVGGSRSVLWPTFMKQNNGNLYVDESSIYNELDKKIHKNYDIDSNTKDYTKNIYKAIHKTINAYSVKGNLKIKDWEQWREELYNNAVVELCLDSVDNNFNEEETSIDCDEIFDELAERICFNWDLGDYSISDDFNKKIHKAIDKTIKIYSFSGKLIIEDWNMWDQDLYNNAVDELGLTN